MKTKITLLIISIVWAFDISANAQYAWGSHFNQNEYIFGVGASQFLGDLGGSGNVGTHFLNDFNLKAIRYGGEVGYRNRFSSLFAAKTVLNAAMIYGDDSYSTNYIRHNRNLNFRSSIIELSGQFEYYFYRSKTHMRYHLRNAKGFGGLHIDAYIFAGIGGFYFNPQGRYTDGKWYNLAPLSTEGEGLPGGPAKYSRLAIALPFGIGIKHAINNNIYVGCEISTRLWTSTDYLDDCHGKYYNNALILENKGAIAAYFADPSLGEIKGATTTGQERGDATHNDTYMFTTITVTYRPTFTRRTRSKF